EVEQALAGPDERGRGDEPGHLVARPKRLLEPAVARHAAVVGVRENRASHPVGVPLLPQDLAAAKRMIVERRPALVVEIMEQADDAPGFLVLAELAGGAPKRAPHRPPSPSPNWRA